MKTIIVALLLSFLVSSLPAISAKVESWNIESDLKTLSAMGFSIDYVNKGTNTLVLDLRSDTELRRLQSLGFKLEVLPDETKQNAVFYESYAERNGDSRAYYTYDQYLQFMQQTALAYPSICTLVQIGTSMQNRPIVFLKISDNVASEEFEPEFMYISSIHGDEVVGYDLLIRMIQLLTSQYGSNPRITDIINNTELWISPMVNPDGFALQQRYNAAGIDLNRNFPMPTGVQHPDGNDWAHENVLLMNFLNGRNIVLSANYHGGALVMNFPWDYTLVPTADHQMLYQASLTYAQHNLPMYNSTEFENGVTHGSVWYIITGSFQDWNYAFTSNTDITCEVSNVKWPPASQLDTFWSQNQESMLSYIEFVQKGVKGLVTSNGGIALDAMISIAGNGKKVFTDPAIGNYHRLLLPGDYSITATATGYLPQTYNVSIPLTGTLQQDFVLSPAGVMAFDAKVRNVSGNPIANATVKLLIDPQNPLQTVTDAEGSFGFASFTEGDYQIQISASGYAPFVQTYAFRQVNDHAVFIVQAPVFTDDFTSGLTNWTVQNPWGIHQGFSFPVLADSPSGNYANNINRSATLQNPLNLSSISSPMLSFKTKYDLESGYDFVHVETSLNGSTWTTLQSFSGSQSEWEQIFIPLNQYAGQSVRLRFRIRTDTSVVADGIYIGDLSVSGLNQDTVVYGDVDGNWIVDYSDASYVLHYGVGNDPIPTIDTIPWSVNRIEAADLNNDNYVDAVDAFLIGTYARGTIPPVMGGNPYSGVPVQVNINAPAPQLNITFANPNQTEAFNLWVTDPLATLSSVNFGANQSSCLTAYNLTSKRIALCSKGEGMASNVSAQFNPQGQTHLALNVTINGVVQDIEIPITLDSENPELPNPVFALYQNHPNPFNPTTTIRFSLASASDASLEIFNVKGQRLMSKTWDLLSAGLHSHTWSATDRNGLELPSGVYFYRLRAGANIQTHKMLLVK